MLSTMPMPLTAATLAVNTADTRNPEYQALKGRIHTELLNRLNLDRLATIRRDDAEPELRSIITGLLEREQQRTPLSMSEREALVIDVLNHW